MKSFIATVLVVSSFALASEIAVAAGQGSDPAVQRPVAKPVTVVGGAGYIGW